MQLSINIKDESKIDFLLELFKELKFIEILSSSNGEWKNHAAPKNKKLTAAEQDIVDDLRESFELIDLHLQGKIKLKPARELLAEL